jgi:hypothetical protein
VPRPRAMRSRAHDRMGVTEPDYTVDAAAG